MNIVLIGHEGYLGQGLLTYLQKSHRVIGWDKKEDLFALDADVLARESVSAVINLSVMADRNVAGYEIDTPGDKINVGGARHLARILQGTGVAWFQISTREVFGPVFGPRDVTKTKAGYRPKFLIDEEHPFKPRNPYAKSKLMAEFISESHPKSNVIRLTTCYTDFDHPRGTWIIQLLRKGLSGETVTLTRGGLAFRDPLHTDDLGRLIELCMEKGVYGQKFHAGGGKANFISLREVLRIGAPGARTASAPGGDYGFAFDNRKALKLVGWKPKVLLREKLPLIAGNVKSGSLSGRSA